MVAISSLSVAANELRTLLQAEIDDLELDQIKIGHPKQTFDEMDKKKDVNYLNLFFYNIKYDGYPSGGLSEDPFYVRLYCLVTAVGGEDSKPSPGENDLRLIGEVMRVLHEQPQISVDDENNEEIVQLQIVPYPLNLDNLNHIWSTQGETAYRLSVAYEMALAPVPLAEAVARSPRVGEIGTSVQGDMEYNPLPDTGFGIETSPLLVPKFSVNVERSDWTPHICFLDQSDISLHYTLLLPVSSELISGLVMKVLIAGNPSAQVDLVWETWNPDDGVWEGSDSTQNETITIDTIDPNNVDPAQAIDIELPLQDKGQATLYAQREWERSDGSTIMLRSNPLLVTVYEAGP